MKELMISILEYVTEERELPEDLIYAFSKETTKILQCRQISSLPESFWELADYVEAFWRGRRFEYAENSLIIYQMGRLLSFTNMIYMMAEETEKVLSAEEHAEQWKERYPVFLHIHKKKGITHKELSDATGIKVPYLSQFMNKVKWEGFFYCRPMGREKHYYLTEYGEKIYELMKEKDEEDNADPLREGLLSEYFIANVGSEKFAYYNADMFISNRETNNGLQNILQKISNGNSDLENEEKVKICKAMENRKMLSARLWST